MPASARRNDRVLLALAFLLALVVRMAPLPAATRGGLRLLSPDCYGHLRRSVSVARNFPRVPFFDPYLNHPSGGVWIWPPLFDLAIGGAARLVFGRTATVEEVTRVAAAVPPLLGALQTLPLFALARRALSRRRAHAAAFAYAVLPAAALWGCFGHSDQHVAEALLLLVFLATLAAAVDRRESEARRRRALLGAGLTLGAAVLTWQGAVFLATLSFPWALVTLGAAAPLLGAAATLVAALGVAAFLAGESVPFSFISFGWFQPLFLAAGTIPLSLWGAWRGSGRRRVLSLALALVAVAAVFPAAPRLAAAAFRGSGYFVVKAPTGLDDVDPATGAYLSYPPEFLNTVFEGYPILRPDYLATLAEAVRSLSIGFLALPLALGSWGLFALRRRNRPGRRDIRLLLVFFGGPLLLMTLLQRRNVYYLGVFTALALSELVARVLPRNRRLGAWAPALAVLVVVAPGAPLLSDMARYADAPGPDYLDLMRRLKALDPPPADPAALPPPAPGAIAGVMAPWSAGHYVTALAERPAAADPFVYGWRRQCRLFTTPDDAEALRILAETRCRYLVTTDLRPVLPAYAAAAGRPATPIGAMFVARVHADPSPHPLPFLTLVLTSRTAAKAPDGRLVPRFKVFRVEGVEDLLPGR